MMCTIGIFFICYYNIFKVIRKNHIEEIFNIYITFTKYVSILGIVQFVVYAISQWDFLLPLYGYSNSPIIMPGVIRVYSIMDEPSYFSAIITPAFVYHFLSDSFRCKNYPTIEKFIVYTALILTFSSTAYVIIALCFIYKYFFIKSNKEYITLKRIVIIIIIICAFFSKSNSDYDDLYNDNRIATFEKIEETYNALSDPNATPNSYELLNLSSYATLTNMWVAINSPNRILGTGIGTHVQNYHRNYKSSFKYYGLNSEDGYSLANRIYSELGIFGMVLLFIFIYKNFNKKSIINISVFFLLLSLCLRGGNYVRYGTIFFFYLYYYTNNKFLKYD